MTKFLAAAHDPDSLLARRARLKAQSTDGSRATGEEPAARGAEPGLDSDMQDLVTRFEQNFAELAPARDEPQSSLLSDDLFPDFPEQVSDTAPSRNRPRALELARIEPQAPREVAAAAVAPVRRTPTEEELDIDEAFSILKAAEDKGAANARHDAEHARTAAAERPLPKKDVKAEIRRERLPRRAAASQESSETLRSDWASRSHRPRSIAFAGGVVVLALGLTLGYFAGRMPGKSHAVIQATQQGGAVLKLDRTLRQR